jgi:hypothetical protein
MVIMNADFKTLLDFLSHYGAEASGRALPEPESHIASLLERFARGECTPAEREDVCQMLKLHPAWLRWLADRVKLARKAAQRAEGSVASA